MLSSQKLHRLILFENTQKLHLSDPNFSRPAASCRFPYDLRLPIRRHHSLKLLSHYGSTHSQPSNSSAYIASVGSPPLSASTLHLSHWNLTHRHIVMLNVFACAAAVSATWLFVSAIPALLSFKKAAESLEKLMDTTREELPDTMAAIRLSGMEISDLTMELSDLGQEITQGFRSSTRTVRLAEQRLQDLANMAKPASLQRVASPKIETGEPVVAKNARGMREGIVKGRMILQLFFTLTQFSKTAFNYFTKQAKQ